MTMSFVHKDTHITIYFDDGTDPMTIYKDNTNKDNTNKYKQAVYAFRHKDFDTLRLLASPAAMINYKGKGKIYVEDGIVYYNDIAMHNTLTDRIIDMIEDKLDVDPMFMFMENLMNNSSKRAVDELYGFLEAGNLPITADGHFLAYKKINHNWTDCHTGTINNSIGQVVEMTRNTVDDNKQNTCSSGLHFCAREYLSKFGGDRTVVVKINPADVVSIPTDYNNAKGRCCKYKVICELAEGETLEGAFCIEENIINVPTEDEMHRD